jgi:DNA-binding NarL/FixJ family response regulator
MVAEGLAAALTVEPDLIVVGIAASVGEGVALVRGQRPDVVLMDYRLPDGDGATATAAVKKISPESQVVMMTALGGQDILVRAIEAGCAGFLHKTKPIDEVRSAVRRTHGGETFFSREILTGVLSQFRRLRGSAEPELSGRELEVLGLLARGASTDEIARQLFLSVHTVRNHVRAVLSKLGAHSKLEAVAIAARDGIIALGEHD